ncbi:GNAT family N-acetyltransferase [Nocardioides mesophilus]|nr:GNAT family N-acetyltransferase [Nocardioides mesophilus]
MTAHPPSDVLPVLERYYDAAPRPSATTEEIGPFTLFLRASTDGWPYYARPRLGLTGETTADDVRRVRQRQRELGVPETFEWVEETTPSLSAAADGAGLAVTRCPLLALPAGAAPITASTPAARVELLGPEDVALSTVQGAVHAGFDGTDEVSPRPAEHQRELMRRGLLAVAAAYDEHGEVVGGGSHGPRGDTTELTGIAVLRRARRQGVGAALTAALVADAHARDVTTVFLSAQDDAVARVYERVGFVRVGTACLGEPA